MFEITITHELIALTLFLCYVKYWFAVSDYTNLIEKFEKIEATLNSLDTAPFTRMRALDEYNTMCNKYNICENYLGNGVCKTVIKQKG